MSATAGLVPVKSSGWSAGLGNMLLKEHGVWWRTRRWLVHLVLWIVVINGFMLLVNFGDRGDDGGPRALQKLSELLEVFFRVGGFFATVGVVTVTQSVVVQEKQLGTAAWLLTKPIARPAFIVAKLLATAYAVLFLMVLVPTTLFLLQTRLVFGVVPAMPGFGQGVALLALSHLFYVALTVMLGTLFNARGAVSGTAIGFMFAGFILPNVLAWSPLAFPWMLPEFGAGLALGRALPPWSNWPVLATMGWMVVFVAVAIWRWGREEF
ncbi:MAG TPA: ABC transporter permease [Gemmatimonadales bacterium]